MSNSSPSATQQSGSVFRSYQSFRFPFATDETLMPSNGTGGDPATAAEPVAPQQTTTVASSSRSDEQPQDSPQQQANTAPTTAKRASVAPLESILSPSNRAGSTNSPVAAPAASSSSSNAAPATGSETPQSTSVSRAPPRALPRRASMVSFRVNPASNASFGEQVKSVEGTPQSSPRVGGGGTSEASSPPSLAADAPLSSNTAALPEVSSPPPPPPPVAVVEERPKETETTTEAIKVPSRPSTTSVESTATPKASATTTPSPRKAEADGTPVNMDPLPTYNSAAMVVGSLQQTSASTPLIPSVYMESPREPRPVSGGPATAAEQLPVDSELPPPTSTAFLGSPSAVSQQQQLSNNNSMGSAPIMLLPVSVASKPDTPRGSSQTSVLSRGAVSPKTAEPSAKSPTIVTAANTNQPSPFQRQLSPPVLSEVSTPSHSETPRELSASTRGSGLRAAPQVPVKRADPNLVKRFQEVVRQKMDQQKKEEKEEQDQQRHRQEEADRTRIELLMQLRQAEEEERLKLEAERKALQEERIRWQEERAEWSKEREQMLQELHELKKERTTRTIASYVSPKTAAPAPASPWRGDAVVVSPNRDEFRKIDPLVLRELLQHSPHNTNFPYEPPAQVPQYFGTAKSVSEAREAANWSEDRAKAEVLRHFDAWKEPVRYVEDVPVLRIEEKRSPLQDSSRTKRASSSQQRQSPERWGADTNHYEAVDTDGYVDVEVTPSFRLFPKSSR